MCVNDGGSITEVNDVQRVKALPAMLVTDGGSVTEVKEVQSWKSS